MSIRRISIFQKPMGKQGHYYHDNETGRDYRRIYAGVHWPELNPGTIITIAEDLHINPPESLVSYSGGAIMAGVVSDVHKWRVISEYATKNPQKLLERCHQLRSITKVDRFFADTTNMAMMRRKNRNEFNFRLTDAPGIEDLNTHKIYLPIIYEKNSISGGKSVFYENCPNLQGELNSLNNPPSAETFQTDYPHCVALVYAFLGLDGFPYEEIFYDPEASYSPWDPMVGL